MLRARAQAYAASHDKLRELGARLTGFLRGELLEVLLGWAQEAAQEETPDGKRRGNQNTMVVVHGYIALLFANMREDVAARAALEYR